MFNWLKRYFIPHIGNAYKPHFLMGHNTRQLLGVVIGFELIFFILPVLNFVGVVNQLNLASVLPSVLSTLTNEEREESNLPDLIESRALDQVAQEKASDMALKSYFAHTSPEGLTPWYWFQKVGYSYQYAGENLAVNFTDSYDVTEAWMNSPTHKANIINGLYTEVGTGIATGIYKGQETIFVAQVYGKPASTLTVAPAETEIFPLNPQVAGSDEIKISAPAFANEDILGEATPAPQEPTFIQKAFSSPRQTTNAVLYVILSIVIVALFLEIAIKFQYQHPDLLSNGLLVVAVVLGLYVGNGYIADREMETTFIAFGSNLPANSLQE